ncbi:MAG TPA: helix-turn-helix domain-containing protein [Nitrospiraceae bacterium]|nr:helix-turn-helix domain-containing protein [Nitrospiraceae bacterium]
MILTKSEHMELQRQARVRNGRADSARHARLILLLAEGLTWVEIRAKLDCSDSYINRWNQRFATDRLAGLFANPNPRLDLGSRRHRQKTSASRDM